MELYAYIHQNPPPNDASTTSETLSYLEACNKLFEQGFLSHDRIRSMDSKVLKNIQDGYSYFSKWLTSILDQGKPILQFIFISQCFFFSDPSFQHTSVTQKSFSSWQSMCTGPYMHTYTPLHYTHVCTHTAMHITHSHMHIIHYTPISSP